MEAASDTGRLYLRMVGGLLGAARPGGGHHGCGLFLIRKTELDVNSLYHSEGPTTTQGFNPRPLPRWFWRDDCALGLLYEPLHFLTITRGS